MREMQQIVEDYNMGYITPTQVVMQMLDVLAQVGASDVLSKKASECLEPLADYMCGIIGGNGNSIANFEVCHKRRAVRKCIAVRKH